MKHTTLGALEVSRLGLGTMGMSAFYTGAGVDDAESIRTIRRALELGVNWIDTAAIYGHGRSEQIVGEAIRGRRDSVLIATKCGRVWEGDSREIGKSLTRESILREVDASLRRLGIDVIDLYQIHWPEPDEQVEEGWATVADLVKAGKVRFGGSGGEGGTTRRIGRSRSPLPRASAGID